MHTIQPLTLRHNFSWTFLGNVVYAGCQWAMLVVLAKLGTPEMVGQFTLGLAVTAPMMLLCNLQLRAIQATDTQGQYQFVDYFSLRLVTTTLAVVMIVGAILLGGYQSDTAWIIFTIGIAKAIESISDVFYGFLQQQERMDRIASSMIIKGILSLITLGMVVAWTGNLVWGTAALAVTWMVVLIAVDVPNSQKLVSNSLQVQPQVLKIEWHPKTLLKLTRFSLPLGLVMMLISLQTNIPRYFIEHYLGQRELGIFAAIAYLQVVGTTVVFALGQSTVPKLAKYYASRDQPAFSRLILKLIGIGAILGGIGIIAAIVVGKQILVLLYRPEYAEYVDVFRLLMIASAIGYVGNLLGYAITATRAFTQFVIPYASITTVAAGMSYCLIPAFGLMGAAWVSCLVSVTSCVAPLLILVKLRRVL